MSKSNSSMVSTQSQITFSKKPRYVDLTGKRFGMILVKSYAGNYRKGVAYWNCVCDCGTTSIVRGKSLTGKNGTKSCGCYALKLSQSRTKHKQSRTITYKSWMAMKSRCFDVKSKNYLSYGLKGIVVCDRWVNSFTNFIEDMGERPSKAYSLDRIDNNGNYEPKNCRWATSKQQCRNRGNNKSFTYNGITLTLPEWSEIVHIPYHRLFSRIVSRNWSVEKALTTPTQQQYNRYQSDSNRPLFDGGEE